MQGDGVARIALEHRIVGGERLAQAASLVQSVGVGEFEFVLHGARRKARSLSARP